MNKNKWDAYLTMEIFDLNGMSNQFSPPSLILLEPSPMYLVLKLILSIFFKSEISHYNCEILNFFFSNPMIIWKNIIKIHHIFIHGSSM
jgi:hypothetical protein